MRSGFKRKMTIALAALMIGLTGCTTAPPAETEEKEPELITVGFSQLGAESDWRVANTESIKSSLSLENGYNLMFDDAQQKQEKQLMAVRNFTQQEVDCIIIAPVIETGWDTVLQEAKDAGVPVIVVDRRVDIKDESLYKAWVGSDFDLEGRMACEWLKSYCEAIELPAEDIRIVDIQGTLGATAQIGRSESLNRAAAENNWTILAAEPADYTQAKGKEVMEQLLNTYEDINVVYCENDNEAIGVIEAIEESGRKVGADIKNGEILIISFDAARSGLRQVLDGKITLDVECNPLQGEALKEIIKHVIENEEFDKYTYVEEKIFSSVDTVKDVEVDGTRHEVIKLTEEILQERDY